MKIQKALVSLLYILLLLACLGVVWMLGKLNGGGYVQNPPAQETVNPESPGARTGAPEPEGSKARPERNPGEDEVCPGGTLDETLGETQDHHQGGDGYVPYHTWNWEGSQEEEAPEEEPYVPPTILLASDLHYISRETHDEGAAFHALLAKDDGKISQYSDVIIDALLDRALECRPSALVLAGDNTLNGEKANHQGLAEKLQRLQDAGIQVLVVPGNHDINNTAAAQYFGDEKTEAEYLHSADEFFGIFHSFGYDQAISRDPASLSYVYALDETHWMLMLDSCQYENWPLVNGRIREETLLWMEGVLDLAAREGIFVLPLAHHNLLSESRLYKTDCTMLNHGEVTELLERYRIPLYLSGHLHAQRIKKHKDGPGVADEAYGITEIVLSPFSIPPCQYGMLAWDEEGGLAFETCAVDVPAWLDKRLQGPSGDASASNASENPNTYLTEEDITFLRDFPVNAPSYMKGVIRAQLVTKARSAPRYLQDEMADLYAELYYHYCAGSRMTWENVQSADAYRLWEKFDPDSIYVTRMKEMTADVREELHDWQYGPAFDSGFGDKNRIKH